MEHIYDVIIVGGGPGGYSAALYCARAGLDVVVLEKLSAGGQMNLTEQIDNYPGFDEGIDGFTLGDKMRLGAQRFGAKTQYDEVLSVELTDKLKIVKTSSGIFTGRSVIWATGAEPRALGLPNEASLIGRGVSYCATCDGMFYRGKTVVIIGGGNTAVAEAIFLSRICKKVYVVHRRDTLRATKIYHDALLNAENVEMCWNSIVTELLADGKVNGVKIKDVNTGDERILDTDGVFVSIGRKPITKLIAGQIDLDNGEYVIADETTKTNIPGVFAVGDVRTKTVRQVVTAAADGAVAAHYVEEYLDGQ